jgi:hypothetical protein
MPERISSNHSAPAKPRDTTVIWLRLLRWLRQYLPINTRAGPDPVVRTPCQPVLHKASRAYPPS